MLSSRTGLSILLSFFIADIFATIFVWLCGIILKNSSLYDPYWSVAPPVFVVCWIIIKQAALSLPVLLLLIAVFIWGIRLTFNWINRWKGLSHQDWRYTMLKEKSPNMWFFTNLVGINLMPTIIVFISCVPAYYTVILSPSLNDFSGNFFNPNENMLGFTIPGFLLCIACIVIQAVSDRQMDNFKKENYLNVSKHIDRGVWKYSRHPNYFGEVFFWWGIWIMQLGYLRNFPVAKNIPVVLITIAGPLLMTLLFILISIPMMEKYIMMSKPSYKYYKKQVSMFLPWFRFKQ
ncbi:MAG: DUF1295 domain-containing protein [Actinobacteria bacterium]|nr:DUF1295 domain-containing protein [Actinomycetota bacterium]